MPRGPDLAAGVPLTELPEGEPLGGHVAGEPVLLVREGDTVHAVGAHCSHYGGPLAEGLVVDGAIRCPWHHAAFDLASGAALRPPALADLPCWKVEVRDGRAVVTGRREPPAVAASRAAAPTRASRPAMAGRHPESVVVVGGGAAGLAAVVTLRREGYQGPVTLVTAEREAPVDRPNLSKDYLAGTASEDWLPLRADDWYVEQGIALRLGARAARVEPARKRVTLEDGTALGYDALLLATGADPVRLSLGPDARVHYLRTLDDCRGIIDAAQHARAAVVLGASFIGLEVAAALRTRGLEVTVVAPESLPLERVLGGALGRFVREVHEGHGVRFRLGHAARSADRTGVVLDDGSRVAGDLVVAGVGVRPNVDLAVDAGLAVDRGILVNGLLETSAASVFAVGDAARWPDPHTGRPIRVEHWVVAQRQGQTAARNILGGGVRFDAVPFFWSAHYDVTVSYVGHAERPDRVLVDGDPRGQDCTVRYFEDARLAAVASIGRDRESLQAEVEMEHALHRAFAGRTA